MSNTLIVFHRCGGKSLGYPPNTLLTIKWALSYGAKAIEYDIVFCEDNNKDKIIVVEPKVLKKANLDINNLKWQNVLKLNAGNDKFGYQKVPELEEVLGSAPDIHHQIHIKGNHPQTVSTLLQKLEEKSNFVITSFDIQILKQIKKINNIVRVGWLVKPKQERRNEGLTDLTALVTANPEALPTYSLDELNKILNQAKVNLIDIVILCAPRIKEKIIVDTVKKNQIECGAWGAGTNIVIAKRLIDYNIDRFTIDNPEELI